MKKRFCASCFLLLSTICICARKPLMRTGCSGRLDRRMLCCPQHLEPLVFSKTSRRWDKGAGGSRHKPFPERALKHRPEPTQRTVTDSSPILNTERRDSVHTYSELARAKRRVGRAANYMSQGVTQKRGNPREQQDSQPAVAM